jgi:hypothetical protein
MHWGVVGFGKDAKGFPNVWHSQKSDSLRCTSYHEFCFGHPSQIHSVPANPQEALRIIERLKSKEGLPWHLLEANCEMVTRWAVENKPVSHQLAFGALAVVAAAAFVAIAASGE